MHMSRTERTVNLLAVVLPLLAVLAIPLWAWNDLVGPVDLAILAAMYLVTGVGITIGYHRLLTHRAFRTHPRAEQALAVLGSMALQGSVLDWVADHRKHHAHTDREGDPHSPHVGHGDGVTGVLRGLWHAHVGWLFRSQGAADWKRYAPDLFEDPAMRAINRRFDLLAVASLVLPFLLGLAITGTWAGALTALLWGGLIRVFLLHHVTWSINSVCHFMGRRRFDVDDESRNVFWLALPSLGEAWHHNHHAFPRSAFHGLRWWELDPSGWLIRAARRAGLVWNVVEIPPERQRQRIPGSSAGVGRPAQRAA
jgi:stearoyl-CoA desaturase (Delta-9 desaturase)